jgi:hypothetical protein
MDRQHQPDERHAGKDLGMTTTTKKKAKKKAKQAKIIRVCPHCNEPFTRFKRAEQAAREIAPDIRRDIVADCYRNCDPHDMVAEFTWAMEFMIGVGRGLVSSKFKAFLEAFLRRQLPNLRASGLRMVLSGACSKEHKPIDEFPHAVQSQLELVLRVCDVMETLADDYMLGRAKMAVQERQQRIREEAERAVHEETESTGGGGGERQGQEDGHDQEGGQAHSEGAAEEETVEAPPERLGIFAPVLAPGGTALTEHVYCLVCGCVMGWEEARHTQTCRQCKSPRDAPISDLKRLTAEWRQSQETDAEPAVAN